MPRTMTQKLHFKAEPQLLFRLYTDAKLHAEVTDSPAEIRPRAGEAFSAWDGYIIGRNVHVEADRMIVQTWRGSDWDPGDADSVFILLLTPEEGGTEVSVTHANIPDAQFEGVREGWTEYYWKPWKAWLARQATIPAPASAAKPKAKAKAGAGKQKPSA